MFIRIVQWKGVKKRLRNEVRDEFEGKECNQQNRRTNYKAANTCNKINEESNWNDWKNW